MSSFVLLDWEGNQDWMVRKIDRNEALIEFKFSNLFDDVNSFDDREVKGLDAVRVRDFDFCSIIFALNIIKEDYKDETSSHQIFLLLFRLANKIDCL